MDADEALLLKLRRIRDLAHKTDHSQLLVHNFGRSKEVEADNLRDALISVEREARTRDVESSRVMQRTLVFGEAHAVDGSVTAKLHPPLKNVRSVQVIGGVLHHPSSPTFRANIEDSITFVYVQELKIHRVRMSIPAANPKTDTLQLQLKVSPDPNDHRDAGQCAVRRQLTDLKAHDRTSVQGGATFSFPRLAIVVRGGSAPALTGAAYTLQKTGAFRVDVFVAPHSVTFAGDCAVLTQKEETEEGQWTEDTANGRFAGRESLISFQLQHVGNDVSEVYESFLTAASAEVELTHTGDQLVWSRAASAEMIFASATMSMHSALHVLQGALNHFASILEGAAHDSTDVYIYAGAYGSRCALALRPPSSSTARRVKFLFSRGSRSAAAVFGFPSDADVVIERGGAALSPSTFLSTRGAASVSVRCEEMSSASGGPSRGPSWFDYTPHDQVQQQLPSTTITLGLGNERGLLEFPQPLAILDQITLQFFRHPPDEQEALILATEMPASQTLVLQAVVSSFS
jgi:hypothetical protein